MGMKSFKSAPTKGGYMDGVAAKTAGDFNGVPVSGERDPGIAAATSNDLSLLCAGTVLSAFLPGTFSGDYSPSADETTGLLRRAGGLDRHARRPTAASAPMQYRFLRRDFADWRLVDLAPPPGGFEHHHVFQRNSHPFGKVEN
jgi:hypothetical protein